MISILFMVVDLVKMVNPHFMFLKSYQPTFLCVRLLSESKMTQVETNFETLKKHRRINEYFLQFDCKGEYKAFKQNLSSSDVFYIKIYSSVLAGYKIFSKQQRMQSEVIERSSSNMIHPDTVSPYTSQLYRSVNFTFRKKEHQTHHHLVTALWLVLVLLGLLTPVCLIQLKLGIELYIFLIELAVSFIPINIYIFLNKNHFSRMIKTWSILINITFVALAVVLAINAPYLGAVLSLYALIDITASFFLLDRQGIILVKTLLYLQLLIIGFKHDNIIQSKWSELLFGAAIFFIFSLGFSLIFSIYTFIKSLLSEDPFFFVRKEGYFFHSLNILCFSFMTSTPLWLAYINDDCMPPLVIASGFFWLTAIYIYQHFFGISIFLCSDVRVQLIKEPPQLQSCTVPYKSVYKASNTWFVSALTQQIAKKVFQPEECLGCMSIQANTVWMPCGHCVLCLQCTKNMISKSTKCPLCKQEPMTILRVGAKGEAPNGQNVTNEMQILQSFKISSS